MSFKFMEKYRTDIVIIGAGPAGLFAVFEAGMLKMKCHVIDALDMVGGQCAALYPEKPIYDIPAHPKIDAIDLVKSLEEQAEPFDPVYHLGQRVEEIKKHGEYFELTTSLGRVIEAKAVIIAAGCGAFGPNRPPLEGIQDYEGKSIFYMVAKKETFKDKNVVIAGGGDSAVDWAISLAPITKKLSIVHRRPKFRCAPDSYDKLCTLKENGKIDIIVPYQLDSIEGENGNISEVVVVDLDGNQKRIEADVLLPFFGLSMKLGPIANWGLNVIKNHIEVDPSTLQTSLEGIFAIGDICTYKGKLKLILNGFAEAAMAAHAAYKIVHPHEALHFEYSTTKGIHVNE
jgi:thioredoxin reductase (NADPH)